MLKKEGMERGYEGKGAGAGLIKLRMYKKDL